MAKLTPCTTYADHPSFPGTCLCGVLRKHHDVEDYSFRAAMVAATQLVQETDKPWHIASWHHQGPYILLSALPPTARGAVHPAECECDGSVCQRKREERRG